MTLARTARAALAALALAVSSGALAAGTDAFAPPAKDDPEWKAGRAAMQAENWSEAVRRFQRMVVKYDDNPDAFNWLAYSYRKSGDLDLAFRHYNTALRLDPNHRGAHEYIGEAYLMKKDLAGAQKHLAALERICGKGCEEYQDLAKAIAEHKARGG